MFLVLDYKYWMESSVVDDLFDIMNVYGIGSSIESTVRSTMESFLIPYRLRENIQFLETTSKKYETDRVKRTQFWWETLLPKINWGAGAYFTFLGEASYVGKLFKKRYGYNIYTELPIFDDRNEELVGVEKL